MKTLIINLPRSKRRFAFQEKQCNQLLLNFDVVQAISIDDISDKQYKMQGFSWQRPLRKVELACFLSHKKAWERVIELNQPCLILEDDAVLAHCVAEVINEIKQLNFKEVDYINFEVRNRKKLVSKEAAYTLSSQKIKLFHLYQDRTGAAAYILYPSGAKKLLDFLQKTGPALADAFISQCYCLNSLQAESALAIQDDQLSIYKIDNKDGFTSTIGRSEDYRCEYGSFSQLLKFKTHRLKAQLAMALRYISVIDKAERRHIYLDRNFFNEVGLK